ncbi:MAG: DUF1957 domain-containing protein [Magnetococcus sp. WYHC-3]
MPVGRLVLLLHAHLPHVRHPETEGVREEAWLFEALTDCHLPLLALFTDLAQTKVPFRLALSVSPTLASLWTDALLQQRYLAHLERQLRLAEAEETRWRDHPPRLALARLYARRFRQARRRFRDLWQRDLPGVLRGLAAQGHLELFTTAATHAFLPLLKHHPELIRAQVQVAAQEHERLFGIPPRGLWLPECGWIPELDTTLREAGFRYTFLEASGVELAQPSPPHGVFAPLQTPGGLMVLGRHPGLSRLVWNGDDGYPGDRLYREFHHDIGFERSAAELGDFLPPGDPTPRHTGLKYHAVTGGTGPKNWYDPRAAAQRAQLHAEDFVQRLTAVVAAQAVAMGEPPLVVLPFDAELFGHWWFEGPQWLEAVLRHLATHDNIVALCHPASLWQRPNPTWPQGAPRPGSWGAGGDGRTWLNEKNAWIQPLLHQAALRMQALLALPAPPRGLVRRGVRHAGRLLLLAQASDWPFIMDRGPHKDYAAQRVRDLLARFHFLADHLEHGTLTSRQLTGLEALDNPFPALDTQAFVLPP